MVLGYGGFLGLSGGNEYRHKFRQATKDFLKKHVFAKNRGQVTCALSVTSGFVFAVATSHGSLIMSGIARRKRRVDDRKTEMIQELKRRSIVLHEMDWMDVCMPNGSFALGVGIVEEDGDHAGLTTPTSSDDVQEIVSRPSTASQEFVGTISVPTDEWVSRGALSVAQLLGIQGPVPEVDAFGTKIADDDSAVDLPETFGNTAAQQLSWWITEHFESPDWNRRASQSLGCSRYLGSTSRTCDCCRKSINSGSYMHCCKCSDDDFDLCMDCYAEGERCRCSKGGLKPIQFAWPGSLFHPNRHEYCERFEKNLNLICDICLGGITQGRYFQCLECGPPSPGGFDICLNCYMNGKTCQRPESHTLYSFMWAFAPCKEALNPYESEGVGDAQCRSCSDVIRQGAFYHCNKCDKGSFDLCHSCYEAGSGCHDQTHVLSRFNSFSQAVTSRDKRWWVCNLPDCQKILDVGEALFACEMCQPRKDTPFILCHSCYSSGAGCYSREHPLKKIRR